jgi:septation ring formation regulator EzrA
MANREIQEPSILATHLIQEANRYNKPLKLVSFYIEKAVDRVSNKIILDELRAFDVPEITISALQQLALIGYAYVKVNVGKGWL